MNDELAGMGAKCMTQMWYAKPNDLIGGWCVMNVDKTPSNSDHNDGEFEIATFMGEEYARHIADLHNASLAMGAADKSFGTPLAELMEWFEWWQESDTAPAKMPRSLHVRTACTLSVRGLLDWDAVDGRLKTRGRFVEEVERAEAAAGVDDDLDVMIAGSSLGSPEAVEHEREVLEGVCSCGRVMLNSGGFSGSYEWNPKCQQHGVTSAWWNHPKRVAERLLRRDELRRLQAAARRARLAGVEQPIEPVEGE